MGTIRRCLGEWNESDARRTRESDEWGASARGDPGGISLGSAVQPVASVAMRSIDSCHNTKG